MKGLSLENLELLCKSNPKAFSRFVPKPPKVGKSPRDARVAENRKLINNNGLILTFKCYLDSPDVNTCFSNVTARDFSLFYFLDDDTIQLKENVLDNSGLKGGMLFGRRRYDLLDENQKPVRHLNKDDLRIGKVGC